jgi:hypothetical protein
MLSFAPLLFSPRPGLGNFRNSPAGKPAVPVERLGREYHRSHAIKLRKKNAAEKSQPARKRAGGFKD